MAALKPVIRHQNDAAKGFDPGLVAVGASGDTIDPSARQANFAIVQNASGASINVTVKRTGDSDIVVAVPAGAFRVIPVVNANALAYSATTSVNVALLSL